MEPPHKRIREEEERGLGEVTGREREEREVERRKMRMLVRILIPGEGSLKLDAGMFEISESLR